MFIEVNAKTKSRSVLEHRTAHSRKGSSSMKVSTIVPQTDHKAQTLNATVANIFAAAARRDNRFEAMVALSQAENANFDWDTGLLLAA